jgi:hypothetical protein
MTDEPNVIYRRWAEAEIERLRARVSELVTLLADHYGTPCEQIRHQQEIERLREARDDAEGRYLAVYEAKCLVDAEVERLRSVIEGIRNAIIEYDDWMLFEKEQQRAKG